MSFGFSVGDFINVGTLAYQIYERCRASVTEFKDLSRDVKSMHIVLKAVQEFWEVQDRNGNSLATNHNRNLQELSNDCKEVLVELEALLDKHGDLGAGAGFLSRMKWVPKNIGPLRMRLLARTNSLSAFNNVITASSAMDQHVKSQARILAALNVINYGYHSGKRTAPAFSQAQTERDLENKETWKDIVQDLKDEGIDKESLTAEEPFIKSWIDEVILADEGYVSGEGSQTEDASERASSVAMSSFNDLEHFGRYVDSHSPRLGSGNPRELSRAQTVPNVASTTKVVDLSNRRPRQSQGSISSQEHKWRPEQPHTLQVKETLMPLFRLEYGVSRDDVFLRSTVDHLYNRLDSLKRGLLRRQFEGQCLQAIDSVEPAARTTIVDIIHAQSKSMGGKFDQIAFRNLFFTILEYLQATKDREAEVRQKEVEEIVEESDLFGESIAYTWLCLENDRRHCEKILPRYCTSEVQSGKRIFRSVAEDIMCHNTVTQNVPWNSMSTFAGMALLADFCSSQLLHVIEIWNYDDPMDRNHLNEYLRILYDVLEAAHKFDILDDDPRHGQANELDRLVGETEIVDLMDTCNLEYESCPADELRKLQHDCYHSLQKMFGFLFDLTTAKVQQDVREHSRVHFEPGQEGALVLNYLETPPRPAHWLIKMEIQAEAILKQCAEWHTKSEVTISRCRDWYSDHQSLSRRADEALRCSEKLKRQAKPCLHLSPVRLVDPVTDKFVCLRLDSLKDLPRGNRVFRAQAPNIFAQILVDNETLHKRFAKRGADKVYRWDDDIYHITVRANSVIQIRFHNANRNDRHDEGFMGLVHLPLESLVTAVQVKSQTTTLENNFHVGPESPGTLTFSVNWCPTAQFLRQPAHLFHGHWARKDTADGRFLFEDLEAEDSEPGSRTAIVERRRDSVKPNPTKLRVMKPT